MCADVLKEQVKVFADGFLLAFRQIHSVQDLWQFYKQPEEVDVAVQQHRRRRVSVWVRQQSPVLELVMLQVGVRQGATA